MRMFAVVDGFGFTTQHLGNGMCDGNIVLMYRSKQRRGTHTHTHTPVKTAVDQEGPLYT